MLPPPFCPEVRRLGDGLDGEMLRVTASANGFGNRAGEHRVQCETG